MILAPPRMERLDRELRKGEAPMVEAREEAYECLEDFIDPAEYIPDEFCENCCYWEECGDVMRLWMFTSGYGKCRCEKFCDEYAWQEPGPPEDGLVVLGASCQATGFVTGPKFGCRHHESREEE